MFEGTVYPALSRLEREGRLTSRLVASNAGPARKYYAPTPRGYAALKEGSAGWLELSAVVEAVLTRPLPHLLNSDSPSSGD